MMEDAGRSYERGLAYLGAARKLLVAARRLDDDDRENLRRLADGFVSKGANLLTSVVKPKRGRSKAAAAAVGGDGLGG
jgi:hypothetical protein